MGSAKPKCDNSFDRSDDSDGIADEDDMDSDSD